MGRIVGVLIRGLLAVVIAAPVLADEPPGKSSERQPSDTDAQVAAVLDRLEKAGQDIRDLRCAVMYHVLDEIGDDEFTKYGQIRFKKADPNPMFLVWFDKCVQDGEVSRRKEWYLFDGCWFSEAKQATKSIIRREMLHPGEKTEPFRLGEGPFPVPFGQKKSDILESFEVALIPASAEDLPGSKHLRLTPKPKTSMADKWLRIDLFVLKDLSLPGKIIAEERGTARTITSTFTDLGKSSVNIGFAASDIRLPKETDKYAVSIEPLEP